MPDKYSSRHARVLSGSAKTGWSAQCPCGWHGEKKYATQREADTAYKAHKQKPVVPASKVLHERLPDGTPVNVTVTDSRKGK